MITDINSEDRLVQQTFADHLRDQLGFESVYAWNEETFGPAGTLGRASEREVVLLRDLRAAIGRLNPDLPESAREQAVEKLTALDFSRSLLQHNREIYGWIRNGVPVDWRDERGETCHARAQVIDFRNVNDNRFLVVRELKIQGVRVPHYNRRADLVCFVNGLPLVFFELKAVYRDIRGGFDNNLTDYMEEHTIAHAFHHNAFLVVSNGDRVRYGSITSRFEHFVEWKRNDESERGRLDAQLLLDGMLAKERLLDLVENFILFDYSRSGGVRKIIARNQQVLGVNRAVESAKRQEELKRQFPLEKRRRLYREPVGGYLLAAESDSSPSALEGREILDSIQLVPQPHRDLGRLGVFWHTQGSGKSYSMVFFAEKVRRVIPGNFTFVMMTDREDLDDQLFRTFVGCGAADEHTPRAVSGEDLKRLLGENHRYVFSLIHKFNLEVTEPYSDRDDIVVVSDEAHRTQAGKLARNMRLALPNASFIGFTGTPIFKHDHLTRRIFGEYVSRYDFQRSVEDESTVRLVYENRGEKLGLARLDLNDRISDKIAEAELSPEQTDLLERLLGKDYEVITADDRLDKLADDFVEHCSGRWETGKSMLVCIDRITCGRMLQRVEQVFSRFKALLMEPSAFALATWHDDVEAIYKKLQKKRDAADVTDVLKELHRIVNEAIQTQDLGDDHAEGLSVDLSAIDFAKLRQEFANKVRRKRSALQDIRDVVENKLQQMLARNPLRMDYYKRYQEIIANYNREKDRATVEETFARLMELAASLDEEQRRAAEEGLTDDELAFFDLLFKDNISNADRERLKQASRSLLKSLRDLLAEMHNWTQKEATQAEVKVFILDELCRSLPRPPFSEQETQTRADRVYEYVWERCAAYGGLAAA